MSVQLSPGFRVTYELDGRAHRVEFRQAEVTVGRSSECDVVLGVPGVSRLHALIQWADDGWMIIDRNSRNGTFVNGQRVTHCRLGRGDQIGFGTPSEVPVTLCFELLPGEPGTQARVVVDDRLPGGEISMTINVEDFERWLAGSAPSAGAGAALDLGRRRVPPIGLFKQIGEVLLSSEALDTMLQQVLGLALDHLPAQRGFICLCDPAGEQIEPRAVKTKPPVAAEAIVLSRSIARAAIHARQALLLTDLPADPRFAQAASIKTQQIRAAMCAPLYHAGQVQGLIYVDTNRPEDHPGTADLELLTAVGGLTAVGIQQARLRDEVARERALRARLARYHSPAVIDQIIARAAAADGEMLSELREVSVLFADLSGFTLLAESLAPGEVARLLNTLFERLTAVVFQYGGTLDKYLGDAVMAIFGAPLPEPDHAERAVRAAVRMQEVLQEIQCQQPPLPALRMRIGINSGTVVAGDIGSPLRKDYTVIGDAVNVASRLESAVAEAGQVVIGPATYQLVHRLFSCRPLAAVQLRGRQQAVCPYLVVGPLEQRAPSGTETTS